MVHLYVNGSLICQCNNLACLSFFLSGFFSVMFNRLALHTSSTCCKNSSKFCIDSTCTSIETLISPSNKLQLINETRYSSIQINKIDTKVFSISYLIIKTTMVACKG